jgi:lambda repressor-like predicted transcriptional regulator
VSISTISSTLTQDTQAVSGGGNGRKHAGLLDVAAKALGMSKADLTAALKSGKSLDDVATAQGVSHDDLAAAIKAGLPPRLANSGKADEIVQSIVSKKGMPERPQPATAPTGPAPETAGSSSTSSGLLGATLTDHQQSTLDQLSSLLGTDSTSLLDSLKSGTSLSDLIGAKGVDQSSLASILQDGLLFDATA